MKTENIDQFRQTSEELLDFIQRSPSVYHVIANMAGML